MPDAFLQIDTYALFPQPIYFRLPSNTEEVLNKLLSNPEDFVNYKLSTHYVVTRRNDLYNDSIEIKKLGQNDDNVKKYIYYKGMVDILDQLLLNSEITPIPEQEEIQPELNQEEQS